MPSKKAEADIFDRVINWRNPPRIQGIVGRTQDDCDGDYHQKLMMRATIDGQIQIWCCYPRWDEEAEQKPPEICVLPEWLRGPACLLWCAMLLSEQEQPQQPNAEPLPIPRLSKSVQELLNNPYWPPGLNTSTAYHVNGGQETDPSLYIAFSPDGDAHVAVGRLGLFMGFRFRTFGGGGSSVLVRNALMIMAEAIRRHDLIGKGE